MSKKYRLKSDEFVIMYMPGSFELRGFKTSDEAWGYIEEHCICRMCKEQLKEGGTWIGNGEHMDEWMEVKDVHDTNCSGEWDVITWEEYLGFGGDVNLKRYDEE